MMRSLCFAVLLMSGFCSSSRGEDVPPETTAVFHQDPAWSPDGKSVVFTSNREGDNRLFIMRSDGSQVRKISDALAFFARWDPKGNAVAAIFGKYPRTAIGILSLDNPEPKWVTPEAPKSSPQGKR